MNIKKAFLFLPGVVSLLLAATPVIPLFTHTAVAASARAGGGENKLEQLNLSDAQKAQMKQIRESTRQQLDAIFTPEQKEQLRTARQQHQKPKLNLSADQKAQMKAIHQKAESQMEAIMTPEQKQKFQEMRQQRRQQHQQQGSH